MAEVIKIKLSELSDALREKLMQRYGADTELEIYVHPQPDGGGLSEEQFWMLIDLLDWSREGDDDAVVEPLVRQLTQLPVEYIHSFQNRLAEKLYHLDGMRYARQIGEDAWWEGQYFSPDLFLYARACVVANGREHYETVLQDPAEMPKDLSFERILYVAHDAHERKTGRPMQHLPTYSYETYSNTAGWQRASN